MRGPSLKYYACLFLVALTILMLCFYIRDDSVVRLEHEDLNIKEEKYTDATFFGKKHSLEVNKAFSGKLTDIARKKISEELTQMRKPFSDIEKSNAVILNDFTSSGYRKISFRIAEPTPKQIETAYAEISKHIHAFDNDKLAYSNFSKAALDLLNEYFFFWKPVKIIRITIPENSNELASLEEFFANNINDLHFDDKGDLKYQIGGGENSVETSGQKGFGDLDKPITHRYPHFLDYVKSKK